MSLPVAGGSGKTRQGGSAGCRLPRKSRSRRDPMQPNLHYMVRW